MRFVGASCCVLLHHDCVAVYVPTICIGGAGCSVQGAVCRVRRTGSGVQGAACRVRRAECKVAALVHTPPHSPLRAPPLRRIHPPAPQGLRGPAHFLPPPPRSSFPAVVANPCRTLRSTAAPSRCLCDPAPRTLAHSPPTLAHLPTPPRRFLRFALRSCPAHPIPAALSVPPPPRCPAAPSPHARPPPLQPPPLRRRPYPAAFAPPQHSPCATPRHVMPASRARPPAGSGVRF